MIFYIGADHRGFKLKESLKKFLKDRGYEVVDLGNDHYDEDDDYPDFAAKVAAEVSKNLNASRGIVICGSGVGVDIVANKFLNIRSVLAATVDIAAASRNDDDTNVLSLTADFTDEEQARKILSVWMQAPFSGETKHKRRIEKISKIEEGL